MKGLECSRERLFWGESRDMGEYVDIANTHRINESHQGIEYGAGQVNKTG